MKRRGFTGKFAGKFSKDSLGGIALLTALLMPVLLGFAGLGVEIGIWYFERRAMQGTADTAAFSAATAYAEGMNWKSEGLAVAAQGGFAQGTNGVQVAFNVPPQAGNYKGDTQAVEAVITKPVSPFLSRFVGVTSGPTILARAVAKFDATNSACMLALSPNASGAISASGSVTVNMKNCGVAANSTSPSAFSMNGTPSFTAASLTVCGGQSLTGKPSLSVPSGSDHTNAPPTNNPYSGLTVPSSAQQCTYDSQTHTYSSPGGFGQGCASSPGGGICVIKSDIKVTGNTNVTFDPGTYILDGASINATSGSISGSGATFVLTDTSNKGKTGSVSIGGNVSVNLTAPSSGPLPGFLFFQDPKAASGGTDSFLGTSGSTLNGALYFPSQQVKFGGNSASGSTGCTQIVAQTIQLVGNASITNSGCGKLGLAQIGPTLLVE